MEHTVDSESPLDFHFWTGISTIAGALRRRVWIDMHAFQWTPNFYIILVGPPGIAAKSTSTRRGMALLEKVEGIKFGPQSLTWQALQVALGESVEYVTYTDPDGLEKRVAMSALTISVPELGTLLKMDDPGLVDVFISMWDGQLETWGHKTKSSGNIEIENPWLNLIGATTPSWLQENFPQHMIGGGLTSRIVFVYGDKKRHLIAYPDEVIQSRDYYDRQQKLVEDLQQIALLCGPYSISAEAREWGREWYHRLWSHRDHAMASDRYSGYISRKQTHIHKLAIVLAAAQSDRMVIEHHHLQVADELLKSVEPQMIKVFESVGIVDEAKYVAEIVQFVRAYKWISGDELWQCCRNIMTRKDFLNAVKQAVEAPDLIAVEKRDGVNGLVPVPAKH